jgi:hypothetical protein
VLARIGSWSVVVLGLFAAAPALAQAPVPGAFGGGTVSRAGNNVVSFVRDDGGNLVFRVDAGAICPGNDVEEIALTGHATPNPDGTFVAAGAIASTGAFGEKLAGRFSMAGTASVQRIDGRLTTTLKRTRKGKTASCQVRGLNGSFATRAPATPSGATKQTLSAPLYGTSSGAVGDLYGSVVVRPSTQAGRIYLVWSSDGKCDHGDAKPFVNTTPAMRVDKHGAYSRHEQFTESFADSQVSFRADTTGRLLTDGASGTIRLRQTVRSPRGKLLRRCDTGTLRWTAAP